MAQSIADEAKRVADKANREAEEQHDIQHAIAQSVVELAEREQLAAAAGAASGDKDEKIAVAPEGKTAEVVPAPPLNSCFVSTPTGCAFPRRANWP